MHSHAGNSFTLEATGADSVVHTSSEDHETSDELTLLVSELSLSSTGMVGDGLSLERRVPFEIWNRIGYYLRPPHLFSLSRVSQSCFRYVRAFTVWKNWWHEFHTRAGFPQPPLIPHPDPQYYMRCMFTIYPLMCEGCGSCAWLDRLREYEPWKLPLPWKVNVYSDTTILLCGPCRVQRYCQYPRKNRHRDPYPKDIVGSYLTKFDIIRKYRWSSANIGQGTVKSIQDRRRIPFGYTYSECAVWEIMCERLGGNKGVHANLGTVLQIEQKTRLLISRLVLAENIASTQ